MDVEGEPPNESINVNNDEDDQKMVAVEEKTDTDPPSKESNK